MYKSKIYIFIIIAILLSSCTENKNPDTKKKTISGNQIVKPELQSMFDSLDVIGSVLIYDFQKDLYYSNNFKWAKKGKLPASTFKVVNSIIALESGVVKDDRSIFKWDGEKRWMKQWEQDLIFKDAFHLSCVPCFQDVARKIGAERMNNYLTKLDYGNMEVDSNNIDLFWLEGKSRINQFQQIDFLKRFNNSKLPISRRTEEIMKRVMIIEERENYRLSGKTGWSDSNGMDNGWFVGYLELGPKSYIFATNVEPKQRFDMDKFSSVRKEITFIAFKKLDIHYN